MNLAPFTLCMAATLVFGVMTTPTAHAVDLGSALKGGLGSAIKGATITEDDVREAADEGCKWMDEHNPIAKAGTPGTARIPQRLATRISGP